MRTAEISRKTKETDITISVNLDDPASNIDVPTGFFFHMLDAFAKHSGIGLNIQAQGDVEVDFHHTVEDVGIVLGQAINRALGDKRGIERYALSKVPMDESMVEACLDISGRPFFELHGPDVFRGQVRDFDLELVPEFLRAFAFNAGITLHMTVCASGNGHHVAEGAFKALARAMRQAVKITGSEIPSTKEAL